MPLLGNVACNFRKIPMLTQDLSRRCIATRRRTTVDYRFHTKEQQDFYETVLLDKKPIVATRPQTV